MIFELSATSVRYLIRNVSESTERSRYRSCVSNTATPDGESAVVELRVTEKQIAQFGEKIADANLKLRMIKELLTSQHLPIPKTKSTVSEDES